MPKKIDVDPVPEPIIEEPEIDTTPRDDDGYEPVRAFS
jgi:hypothetical protein